MGPRVQNPPARPQPPLGDHGPPQVIHDLADNDNLYGGPKTPTIVQEYPLRTRPRHHFPQVHLDPRSAPVSAPNARKNQEAANRMISGHPEESTSGTITESHVHVIHTELVTSIPEPAEDSSKTEVQGPDERVSGAPKELQPPVRAHLPPVPNLNPHY